MFNVVNSYRYSQYQFGKGLLSHDVRLLFNLGYGLLIHDFSLTALEDRGRCLRMDYNENSTVK